LTSTILYQFEISPFCDKVRRALCLKGLNYECVEILPSKASKWRHISPTGKFPALAHDSRIIVDSTEILHYLDKLAPTPLLYPSDPARHALTVLLEDWADESLYFYDLTMRNWPHNRDWFLRDLLQHEKPLLQKLLRLVVPGALLKIAKTQGTGRKSADIVTRDLTALYRALSALLEKTPYLTGDTLTAADLAAVVMVHVLKRTPEGATALAALPPLAAWYARIEAATIARPI
jgi:glutathione S-transferase